MLPYTAEVLFASFEQYNRGLWPLQILTSALALAVIGLALRPVRHGDRAVLALLAGAWLWVGIGYHGLHFATLNFAAPAYAGLSAIQGLVLAWAAASGELRLRFKPDVAGWAGLAITLAALFVWPLADASAHGWQSVRLVGLAPAPTAAFTLGLLLLIDRPTPIRLVIIPLLWSLIAGATAWELAIAQDLALPLIGLTALGMILWQNRAAPAPDRGAGPGGTQIKPTLEARIANAFGMSEEVWARHANPWSVWTRLTCLPLFVLAIWSRVWLGWWALVPLALALVWIWLNPRIFPKPRSLTSWASRGVLGERIWLDRRNVPVPPKHRLAPHVLNAIGAGGLAFLGYGLWNLALWPTGFGLVVSMLAKLWFVDRMVRLFDDTRDGGAAA